VTGASTDETGLSPYSRVEPAQTQTVLSVSGVRTNFAQANKLFCREPPDIRRPGHISRKYF
jgi:hypothetical protein